MCWFRIEEHNALPGQYPMLFQIYEEGNGGYEAYFNGFSLYYRHLNANSYTAPSDEDDGTATFVEEFEPD